MLPLILALASAPTPEDEKDIADLVDVLALDPRFIADVRYATKDNFVGKVVYEESRCLLRKNVAARMVKAQAWLDAEHAGLVLMFKDCYRPHSAQLVLWDAVKGTPKSAYVADPNSKTGSIHSYGAAVDVTLASADKQELDMGTAYDFLGRLAEPRHEAEYLKNGQLTEVQVKNRRILRRAMVEAGGMRSIPNEWWHFDEADKAEIRRRYRRLDIPFSRVPKT